MGERSPDQRLHCVRPSRSPPGGVRVIQGPFRLPYSGCRSVSSDHGYQEDWPIRAAQRPRSVRCPGVSACARDSAPRTEAACALDHRRRQGLLCGSHALLSVSWLPAALLDAPEHDAPKIIDVVHSSGLKKRLEVGVGRPRALYVLYPGPDGDILCRGAVMSYYEFVHSEPLTDEQWKALLDSDECPQRPAWLDSIRQH